MRRTRREFLAGAAFVTAAGARIVASQGEEPAGGPAKEGKESDRGDPGTFYKVFPVGKVEKEGTSVRIRIFERYADALQGLDGWSHVNVLYWLDKNDVPGKRRILRVHPRGNRKNPLTGVFACRAPVRPNLIALSVCRILSVQGSVVNVDRIDAFDSTPVLDLKPFIPPDAPTQGLRVPEWTKG